MRSMVLAVAGAAALMASGCQAPGAIQSIPGMTLGGSFPDECSGLDGFPAFRSALAEAVARRDEASFRALFAQTGYMRMNGVGGGRDAPPGQLSGAAGAEVWQDLDQVLTLGCAAEHDRLFLPATAKVPDSLDASSQKVAIRDTAVRSAPSADAPVLAAAPRGSLLLQFEYPPEPAEGWEYFTLRNGRSGFVPAADLRSTLDTALVVGREGEEWRIFYYGGYD